VLTVGEYIAARRNLGGFSKADALAGERLMTRFTVYFASGSYEDVQVHDHG
jgi:hypothetical protein